jgi:hypothetical protein
MMFSSKEPTEPRRREWYGTPDGISHRTPRFSAGRWHVVFLAVFAFIIAIIIFGVSAPT